MEGLASAPRSSTASRLWLVLAVAVLAFIAYRLGIIQLFADPSRIAATVRELGVWGYIVFVVSYALLQPFGVPGTVYVMAAPLIWPWPVAFALSMTGTMAASVIGFSFARFVARDWLERRIPPSFRKYDAALGARAFLTVVVLRFVFWMPQMLHTFLGVSKVGFWTHFWGSLLGYAVPLLLMSYFGQVLFAAMKSVPTSVWIGVGAVAALLALSVWAIRRQRAVA
jgi:uncharacterized membrane protein YdjX (TVP38/TMEM64 family)